MSPVLFKDYVSVYNVVMPVGEEMQVPSRASMQFRARLILTVVVCSALSLPTDWTTNDGNVL